jgi:hypothetical protein
MKRQSFYLLLVFFFSGLITSSDVYAVPPFLPPPPPPPPPPSRCIDNLLNCVAFGEINVPGQSSATVTHIPGDGLSLRFENNRNGTGVFFKFSSPVNLQNFDRLRIRGISRTQFDFLVEFKVRGSNEPIAISILRTFPATRTGESVFIPIPLENIDGKGIEIIAINCLKKGEHSIFNIESIKLLKPSDPE